MTDDQFKKIYHRAIDLLSRRDHSQFELKNKLRVRDFDEDISMEVIQRLADEGYLCDTRFAENYTRSRMNKGYGPLRITNELRERGIDSDVMERAFAVYDADDWFQCLCDAKHKKFGSDTPEDYQVQVKQMRFLAQRGFSTDQISRVYTQHEM